MTGMRPKQHAKHQLIGMLQMNWTHLRKVSLEQWLAAEKYFRTVGAYGARVLTAGFKMHALNPESE